MIMIILIIITISFATISIESHQFVSVLDMYVSFNRIGMLWHMSRKQKDQQILLNRWTQ